MTKRLLMIFFCVAAVLAPVLLLSAAQPQVGSQAPPFTLKSQDGTPISLQDFHGKWVVLYFYPKDFTSGCTLEAHNFERDLAKYQKLNAVIVGVSVQDANSHKEFCVKEGLSFKLLADTDYTASKEYGTLTETGFTHAARNTFLISPNGKIARVFDDVKPADHSAEVLAALAELEKK